MNPQKHTFLHINEKGELIDIFFNFAGDPIEYLIRGLNEIKSGVYFEYEHIIKK